jgi:5-keto 4-deoxyuronate isomerase
MKLDMRYDTDKPRRHFLVDRIFAHGELVLAYTHVDRVVLDGGWLAR